MEGGKREIPETEKVKEECHVLELFQHTMKYLKIWKDPHSKPKGHTEIWTK